MSTAHRLRILLVGLLFALSTRWSGAASIKIISPSAGETWTIDSTHAILWKSDSRGAGGSDFILRGRGRHLDHHRRQRAQQRTVPVASASANIPEVPSSGGRRGERQFRNYSLPAGSWAPLGEGNRESALPASRRRRRAGVQGLYVPIDGWNWDDKQYFPRNTPTTFGTPSMVSTGHS